MGQLGGQAPIRSLLALRGEETAGRTKDSLVDVSGRVGQFLAYGLDHVVVMAGRYV